MASSKMLISYVPGEECRVAIVEDGRLEEFNAEPMDAVSRVGNIYVGRVANVNESIQAAFVDFGVEDAGFLHISDLHPQYFPGEDDDTTERVGKKTPRRSRPPIQQALRKGQEVIVQVLKEGIGTKGPTLTSYLSIPGRFLVMMPQMDKVGVSRKVEDEDARRDMRKILDQLDLPDGFGFILRTAGMERTKAELKRDLAYLQRLWKDMEKRRKTGGKPRLLYSESDLLVRSLRDQITVGIDEVIIDSEMALKRASRFMKIVSPRAQTKLSHYTGQAPIFHAFDVASQIAMMHAREVPLPSGGRLVIDETEALVAIDVNSGRMRTAKDAESNAFQANMEAVDEICRQLRLRDLGGLVINDLIDMRHASNRKTVENRFRERLKKDRARSTILPISNFGILEMTRQRMRGSHESVHFGTCPVCRGRGLVQRAESVAADALGNLAALMDYERVARVELVVSARVAGALLSKKRDALNRLELLASKKIDVRVSDATPHDHVAFYAYDEGGADIDLDKLPKNKKSPPVESWTFTETGEEEVETNDWAVDLQNEAEELAEQSREAYREAQAVLAAEEDGPLPFEPDEMDDDEEGGGKKKRRRRRRRRRRRSDEDEQNGEAGEEVDSKSGADDVADEAESSSPAPSRRTPKPSENLALEPIASDEDADNAEGADPSGAEPVDEDRPKKKRRRRGGRRRRKSGEEHAEGSEGESGSAESVAEATPAEEPVAEPSSDEPAEAEAPVKKKRAPRRKKTATKAEDLPADEANEAPEAEDKKAAKKTTKKKSRRRKKTDVPAEAPVKAEKPETAAEKEPKPVAPKRGLYSAGRRRLTASERSRIAKE